MTSDENGEGGQNVAFPCRVFGSIWFRIRIRIMATITDGENY